MGKRTTTSSSTNRTVERDGPTTRRTTTTVTTKLREGGTGLPAARQKEPSVKPKRRP